MQIDVVGLGVSTIDILSLVDHLPVGEEVQQAIEMSVQGGGPVATAMVTLARLGASTAMIDSVGDDWRGTRILDEFRQEGVSVDYLKVSKNCTSSTACILVTKETGARSIIFSPGNAPELTPDDVPDSVIAAAKILHVNGRHWEACLQAARIAREAGVRVSFDGGAHRYRPELEQLIPLTDICIVARDFAEKYTRETELSKAANAFLKSGPSLVVITDGINGSWVYPQDGKSFHQPAYLFPKNVDTTGCGDNYHGAFLFGLLKGMGLEKTASLASAVAAINSQHLGSRGGLPTLEQVESFLVERGKF